MESIFGIILAWSLLPHCSWRVPKVCYGSCRRPGENNEDASDTNPMSSALTPVTSPSTRCDLQGNQRVLKTQNALLGNLQFGCFQKWWYPQIIHFNRVFHYKPTILGYPHFWKLAIFNSITNHQIIENWWGETAAFVWAKWRQHSGLNGSSTSRFVLTKKPIKDAILSVKWFPSTPGPWNEQQVCPPVFPNQIPNGVQKMIRNLSIRKLPKNFWGGGNTGCCERFREV